MRAVLDTNVIVSAVIVPDGVPATILDFRALKFTLVTSVILLDELEGVLLRPRIAARTGWNDERRRLFLSELRLNAVVVEPKERLQIVAEDPADDRVLEAAVEGHADFIVSGDSDLLQVGLFRGTSIVTPRQFLTLIEQTR